MSQFLIYIFNFTVLFFISQKFKEIAKIGNGAGVKKSGSDPERNEKIKKTHINYGHRLKEIGKYLGLHYTTASRIANEQHVKKYYYTRPTPVCFSGCEN